MSNWVNRVNNTNTNINMYSREGAEFQEWALNRLDFKGSQAHEAIGKLVTAINNAETTVEKAQSQYIRLLSK
jgi:hypothetical protein